MDDASHNKWDITFKWFGLIAVISGAFWTYFTFQANRFTDRQHQLESENRDLNTRMAELNSFIFQRQTDLYFDAARSAAAIATSRNNNEVAAAKERFEQLFWGKLVVVEDRRVEEAMISFRDCAEANNVNCTRRDIDQYGNKRDTSYDQQLYGAAILPLKLSSTTK
jgi:hypothetical protein